MATNAQDNLRSKAVNKRTLTLGVDYVETHFGTRYIFPIKAGAKFPPLIKNNLEEASNDIAQIEAWEKQWPGCNWGVAHRKSKLLVADIDTNQAKGKVGQKTYDGLDLVYGWPETEKTTTPSGGFHMIYEGWSDDTHPEHIMALGENGIGRDIDSPNYTVIAGCMFDDGTSYIGNDIDAVKCPAWVYDSIKASKIKKRIVADAGEIVVELDQDSNVATAIDFLINDAGPSNEGQNGDAALLKTAYYLKDLGISQELGAQLLNEHFNPRCVPPWDMADLVKKMAGAYTYANLSKVGGKTAEADFSDDPPELAQPMGIYDIERKVYVLDPEKIARQKRERAKSREIEAARPAKVGARHYTRDQLRNRWVWVRGSERFVCRDDPEPRKDWEDDNGRPIYKPTQFDRAFRSECKPKDSKKISDGLLAERKGGILHFESIVYAPGGPEFAGPNYNLYRPSTVVPIQAATDNARAAVKVWNEHLDYLFAGQPLSRDNVLNWLAWRVQNPGKKMKHALILQGRVPGTGKSFLAEVLQRVLGQYNVSHVTERELGSSFNPWAMNTQLIVVEELRSVEKRKVKESLHPLITQERISINDKNVKLKQFKNCFGVMAFTNHDAALSLDNRDRRYLVEKTDAEPRDKLYYVGLYGLLDDVEAMGAIAGELKSRNLAEYSAAASAPMTSAKVEMVEAGGSPIGQWMIENAGEWPLSARLTTVAEVVAILPRHLVDKYADQSVREALIAAFAGAKAGRIPVRGVKKHLWSINGEQEVTRLLRERDAAANKGSTLKVASRNAALAKIYQDDLDRAGRNRPLSADFGDD